MLWGNQSRRSSIDAEKLRAQRTDKAGSVSSTLSGTPPFSTLSGTPPQTPPIQQRPTLQDFDGGARQSNVAQIQRQLQQAAADGSDNASQLQNGIMRKRHSFTRETGPPSITSAHLTSQGRHEMITSLLAAKERTGKSFTELGVELGLTNCATAQLFYNQAQLRPARVAALRRAVPQLTEQQLAFMQRSPLRMPQQGFTEEPTHRVLQEALAHHAAAIKAIMNENWGDIVINPADVSAELALTPGKNGEQRVTLTLSGKYTPFAEHESFVPNGLTHTRSPVRPRDRELPTMAEE